MGGVFLVRWGIYNHDQDFIKDAPVTSSTRQRSQRTRTGCGSSVILFLTELRFYAAQRNRLHSQNLQNAVLAER